MDDNLSREPITRVERLADRLEGLIPGINVTLGEIGVRGATEESQAWVNGLADALEKLQTGVDRAFELVDGVPVYLGDGEPEIRAEESAERTVLIEDLSPEELALIDCFLHNRDISMRALRKKLPFTKEWTPQDFEEVRLSAVEFLETLGIIAGWDINREHERNRYTLEIKSGQEIVEELWPSKSDPGSQEEPAVVIIPEALDVEAVLDEIKATKPLPLRSTRSRGKRSKKKSHPQSPPSFRYYKR